MLLKPGQRRWKRDLPPEVRGDLYRRPCGLPALSCPRAMSPQGFMWWCGKSSRQRISELSLRPWLMALPLWHSLLINSPPAGVKHNPYPFCMTQHFTMEAAIFVRLNLFQIKNIISPSVFFQTFYRPRIKSHLANGTGPWQNTAANYRRTCAQNRPGFVGPRGLY